MDNKDVVPVSTAEDDTIVDAVVVKTIPLLTAAEAKVEAQKLYRSILEKEQRIVDKRVNTFIEEYNKEWPNAICYRKTQFEIRLESIPDNLQKRAVDIFRAMISVNGHRVAQREYYHNHIIVYL
jgi:hypothetical protein